MRERVFASAPVRDSRQPVDERLPLDDRVQPRVLERDGGVRCERRRRHPVLRVEGADEDEPPEPLSSHHERMLDPVAGRVLVSGRGGEAVAVDRGADGARRLDGGLDDDAEELLDVVRRRERLADARDGDPQPAALLVQLRQAPLQLVGHRVERGAERRQLVPAPDGYPPAEMALGDPPRRLGERTQRPDDGAGFEEGDARDDEDRGEEREDQAVARRRVGGVHLRLRRQHGE